jgi:hypothetical protein
MKKNLLLLLPVLTLVFTHDILNAQTPDWIWATGAGAPNWETGHGICTDANGNVYVVGEFGSGTPVSFGTTTLTSHGAYDMFIVKYDSNGNVIWAKNEGGTSDDIGYHISTDTYGNIFVAGVFLSPSITFGSTTLFRSGASGSVNTFIAKYDSNGNVLWAKSNGGNLSDDIGGISVDLDGNVFLTGNFGLSVNFDSTILNSDGGSDIFIAKYDSSGTLLWAKSAGGTQGDGSYGIASDVSGNIYIVGYFSSSSLIWDTIILNNINPGTGIFFVTKLDSNGNALWATSAGKAYSRSISIDTDGNLFVTGYFTDSTDFGGSTSTLVGDSLTDAFIVKFDNTGNAQWSKCIGGSDRDVGNSIFNDVFGNIFVTGNFESTFVTIDTITLSNADTSSVTGSSDIFIAKFDNDGNLIWSKRAGGSWDDRSWGITCDSNGRIYLTGDFWSQSITFGLTTLINAGYFDFYIAALDNVVGMEENIFSNSIKIFPSPLSYQATVYSSSLLLNATLTMYNSLGQSVKQIKNISGHSVILERDHLVPGLYLIALTQNDQLINSIKFVVID